MSLERGFEWKYGSYRFTGYSIAGISTSLVFHNADICFDVAQGLPFQLPISNIALTHGHMDHAGGLPYLLSQKTMMSLKKPKVFLPPSLKNPMQEILKLWADIEDHNYPVDLVSFSPGDTFTLTPLYRLAAFPTPHRVPSQGYLIYESKKQLRREFAGLGPHDLAEQRRQGQILDELIEFPLVAFTGDTKIEFLDAHPDVLKAKILFVEITFWDSEKPIEAARKWGHIHFEEFLLKLPSLLNERIVLIHASARYSTNELNKILDHRLSASDRDRVSLFPRPN